MAHRLGGFATACPHGSTRRRAGPASAHFRPDAFVDFRESLQRHLGEGLRKRRIEVRARILLDDGHGLLQRESVAIRSLAGDGVEHVGDGDDAPDQRDAFAYQGGGRGFDATMLNYLEQAVQSVANPGATARVRQPDLTVWFDLPPEIAAARLAGARAPDKFESESLEFFRRVSQGYLQRLQADTARFARIHADQEREAVWQDVHLAVQARGWLL